MAIPDFQSLMLPTLRLLSDDKDRRAPEIVVQLSANLRLTDSDLEERLPSGRQRRADNRVGWAIKHMQEARLVEKPSRGVVRITPRGHALLASKPERIDMSVLQQYAEYRAFREAEPSVVTTAKEVETPEETIEAAYQVLRRDLAQTIIETIKAGTPAFFEKIVIDVLVAMGYGGDARNAGRVLGRSGDGGIDGLIREDKLGLDTVYIQAKRWGGVVGRPVVQTFAGSLDGVRSRRGVLITTSTFSAEARKYSEQIEKRIVLLDGEQLADLMIDHGVGVVDRQIYAVKKLDSDYFAED